MPLMCSRQWHLVSQFQPMKYSFLFHWFQLVLLCVCLCRSLWLYTLVIVITPVLNLNHNAYYEKYNREGIHTYKVCVQLRGLASCMIVIIIILLFQRVLIDLLKMTLAEFFSCSLLAFGAPVVMFAMTVANDPVRIIILIVAAFGWLLSFLLSSLVWFAVVPLRSQLAFGMVFAIIFQVSYPLSSCVQTDDYSWY